MFLDVNAYYDNVVEDLGDGRPEVGIIKTELRSGDYVEDAFGKKYFYCETTNPTVKLGMVPTDVKGDVDKVIPV